MARGFNLTAEINLRGPANIRQVVSNIRRQLGSISADVNVNINNNVTRNVNNLNTRLGALNATLNQTAASATNATTAFNNLAAAMASVGNIRLPTNIAAPVANITSNVTSANRAIAQTRTEFEDFGRQAGLAVRRFAAFASVTSVIYGVNNAIASGIKQYIEFDRQLTRLSQVTEVSKKGLADVTSEITRLSTSMGVASNDLAQVSVTLAQAGFSARDTKIALEALAKTTLAPSFDNLNQTVEGSIALMRQFGISSKQLEGALGSVNAVAAGFAVEASDLIAAIQRTGGVFASASRGVSEGTDSLNEFLAVFTSVRATTRESAETIATGLRTIFTRIQRADTIEALKEYGVELTDLEGKFVGPYEAVRRLSEGLGRLDPRDLKFSSIVEELGGFRQIGKVLPLIQQFATAQQALKVAQEGQGSLAADAVSGQQALAVQIQKVREEFSALMRSFGDSDSFKTMVRLGLDLASALIKVADATKGLLPLVGIVAAFRGVSAITQFAGGFGSGLGGGGARRRSMGGPIYGFASGGVVPGYGKGDKVPALLEPGEVVMSNKAADRYGRGNLDRMNKYAKGGKPVGPFTIKDLQNSGGANTIQEFSKNKKEVEHDDKIYGKINTKEIKLTNQDFKKIINKSENIASESQYGKKSYKKLKLTEANKQNYLDTYFATGSRKKKRNYQASLWKSAEKRWGTALEQHLIDKAGGSLMSVGAGSFPVDIKSKRGNVGEVKFRTVEEKPETLISKLLRYKIKSSEQQLLSQFKEARKDRIDPVNIGSIDYFWAGKSKEKFYQYLFQNPDIYQQFSGGGRVLRKLGYIDYDVIANPANEGIVKKGMEATGVTGPRLYADKLTELAVAARKNQSISKLRAIYGVAGSGKTTLARGSGTDDATLRKTERFPILSPQDIDRATEIILLSSSVSQKKLDELFSATDRTYTLSSTTKAEQNRVRSQRDSRDATGVGLEGRTPGSTRGVATDTAVGEALLSDRLGSKSVVLGRSGSGRLRRKRGNELVEVIKKKIGVTWGGFAPMTAGHESILDAASAMGYSAEDFLFLVGANEGIKLGDPSSYRTAVFNQDARVLLAKAGAGARGATVLPKAADFEVPIGFDISEAGSDRRKVLLPGAGSRAFVADKTPEQMAKYESAGYKVTNLERTGGISGTMVRDLIMSGNMAELQKVLSPGVYELISNNIGRIQNRANALPEIIETVKKSEATKLKDIEKQIKAVGISRIDKKKLADPEYAAKVQVLEELREQRDKIKRSSAFEPYKLLDDLAKKYPDKYALDFSSSLPVTPSPVRTVSSQTQKANLGGMIRKFADAGVVSSAGGKRTSRSEILKTLGSIEAAKAAGVQPTEIYQLLGLRSPNAAQQAKIEAVEKEYIKKINRKRGASQAVLTRLQNQGLSFAAAGMLGDPFDEQTYDAVTSTGTRKVKLVAGVMDKTLANELDAMFRKETDPIAAKAAEKAMIFDVLKRFGDGRQLYLDFDNTLATGADAMDLKDFRDPTKVAEALSVAKPTRLATELRALIQQRPELLSSMSVITARAPSTLDLIQKWLTQQGLPIPRSQFTGVGGDANIVSLSDIPGLKAALLKPDSLFVDDDDQNIRAARQKGGVESYKYGGDPILPNENTETTVQGGLLEKMVQKLGGPGAQKGLGFDFPQGLQGAAKYFGLPEDIPTDLKRTISGPSTIKDNISTYLKAMGFKGGGEAKAKKPKTTFGSGEFPFPKRISNAYFKEIDKILEAQRIEKAWESRPKNERMLIDEQDIQKEFSAPFNKEMFLASFKDAISRNTLYQRISQFARFVGLPEEDLSVALPSLIDFGGPSGVFGAAAQFDRTGMGTRRLEGVDLSPHGFSEADKQDLFGYSKLIEEKEKQIKKVLKTPVRTFDDGSFHYDEVAATALWQEIRDLKTKRMAKSSLNNDAIKQARASITETAAQTGRGAVSINKNPFGASKYEILYHELTHQLINGLRTRQQDSFTKYKERVVSLFENDNDGLAEAFDALGGYNSADVVYGRAYKVNAIRDMLYSRTRHVVQGVQDAGQQDYFDQLNSSFTKANTQKTAKQFKPINPDVNKLLLTHPTTQVSQEAIDRMEDSGKEEFLTTLLEKAPVLNENLSSILDSTLSDLLGSAGIKRQKFANGGTVPALVSNGEAYVPPKLAKRIGYSKLNKMNQADKNGMGRFSEGGISIFKGPGSGTSDSIPTNLPVGSFIIREKATKALGFSRGGNVGIQRFLFGGSPSPTPNVDLTSVATMAAAMSLVSASTALRNSMLSITDVLAELGVTTSNTSEQLKKNKNISVQESFRAMKADIELARTAGASAKTIDELTKNLREAEKLEKNLIKTRRKIQKSGATGADLQSIINDSEEEYRRQTEAERQNLKRRGFKSATIEKKLAETAEERRGQAFADVSTSKGFNFGKSAASGQILEKSINIMMRDANVLKQMNQEYIRTRKTEIENDLKAAGFKGDAAKEALRLAKEEAKIRTRAVAESADKDKDIGPKKERDNFLLMMGAATITVGNIVADSIDVKSSARNAATAAGIRSASQAFGIGTSIIGELRNWTNNLSQYDNKFAKVATVAAKGAQSLAILGTIVGTVTSATKEAYNAYKQFYIDLSKNRIDNSLQRVEMEFEKLAQTINLVDFSNINNELATASNNFANLIEQMKNKGLVQWVNIFDAFRAYIMPNLPSLLKSVSKMLIGEEMPVSEFKELALILERGGFDAYSRAKAGGEGGIRDEMSSIIPDLAREQAQLAKPIADALSKVFAERFRRGETSADIFNDVNFDAFAQTLANADVALRERILSLENSGDNPTDIAAARKDLIRQAAQEKILQMEIMAIREKEAQSLNRFGQVYTRSLTRTFENMNQVVNAVTFGLELLKDSVDASTKALSGQAQASQLRLSLGNIINNPRGYSDNETRSARANVAGLFGSRSDIMLPLLKSSEAAQASIMSTINNTLQSNIGASNELILRNVSSSLKETFKNIGLPPELSDKMAREVGLAVADLRKRGDSEISFSDLQEKVGALGNVLDITKEALSSANKALEAYNSILNNYVNYTNQLIDLELSKREKLNRSIDILVDANTQLSRSLGNTIDLEQSRIRLSRKTSRISGGASNPTDIFLEILKLNQQRSTDESSRNDSAERGPVGIQDFVKFNSAVKDSSIALRENYAALKLLAENTDYASDAMSRIQEIQNRIGGRVSFIEKIATSSPDELESLNNAFIRLQNNMNGQLNTIQNSVGAQKAYSEALNQGSDAAQAMKAAQTAFSNERKETLAALQDILPFLGEGREAGNIRANVLESMLKESGVGVTPMFAQVLNSLRNPQTDPALAAAIQHYEEANNLQAQANALLANLDAKLANDVANKQSAMLLQGMKDLTFKFENQELRDIRDKINMIVPINAQPKATGGVIYAAAGQMINFQSRGTDTVPAMLTPGEFVVNRKATQANLPLLNSINNGYSNGGRVAYYAKGGFVSNFGQAQSTTEGDLSSKFEVLDLEDNSVVAEIKRSFDSYSYLPPMYTVIDSANQVPRGDDIGSDLDLSLLKPRNGKVVPGYVQGFVKNTAAGLTNIQGVANNIGRNLVDGSNIFKKSDTFFYPDNDLGKLKTKRLNKINYEKWKKAGDSLNNLSGAGDVLDDLKDNTNANPNLFGDIPELDEFNNFNRNEAYAFVITKSHGIYKNGVDGLNSSIIPGYRLYKNNDTRDTAVAADNNAPSFDLDTRFGGLNPNWQKVGSPPKGFRIDDTANASKIFNGDNLQKAIVNNNEAYDRYQKTVETYKKPDLAFSDDGPIDSDYIVLQQKLKNLYNGKIKEDFDQKLIDKYFDLFSDFTHLPSNDSDPFWVFSNTPESQNALSTVAQNLANMPAANIGNKKIGFIQNPPNGVADPVPWILPKPFAIKGFGDKVAANPLKEFPWAANLTLDDFDRDFREKIEQGVFTGNPGNITMSLRTNKGQLNLPSPLPAIPVLPIDIDYSFYEWEGKIYDAAKEEFVDPLTTLFLPHNTNNTIFKNLDISKRRVIDDPLNNWLNNVQMNRAKFDPYVQALYNDKNDPNLNNLKNAATNSVTVQFNKERLRNPVTFAGVDTLGAEFLNPRTVDITEYVLTQLDKTLETKGLEAGKADPGFRGLRQQIIPDLALPTTVRNLVKSSLGLFGKYKIPGFASNWLGQYIGKIPFMKNMNADFAKRASQYSSGIFNSAGGIVDTIISSNNLIPRQSNYLQYVWTLLTGAQRVFAGLGSGNTRFIAQLRNIGSDPETLFKSAGAGASIDKLASTTLNQEWQNILDNALTDGKFFSVGARGTLTEIDMEEKSPENVKDLINLIFNPYNEFATKDIRVNLIDKFMTDLTNFRGNNPLVGPPRFGRRQSNLLIDPFTMQFLQDRVNLLKLWYGGDGADWVGQDHLYDTNINPDHVQRTDEFKTALVAQQYYDDANKAHIELGLGEKFGPLPTEQYFDARIAKGFQTGGIVYAESGGKMVNFQPRGTDTVPAMLTPGEFVVNRAATQKHLPLLQNINSGNNIDSKPYQKGGIIYAANGGWLGKWSDWVMGPEWNDPEARAGSFWATWPEELKTLAAVLKTSIYGGAMALGGIGGFIAGTPLGGLGAPFGASMGSALGYALAAWLLGYKKKGGAGREREDHGLGSIELWGPGSGIGGLGPTSSGLESGRGVGAGSGGGVGAGSGALDARRAAAAEAEQKRLEEGRKSRKQLDQILEPISEISKPVAVDPPNTSPDLIPIRGQIMTPIDKPNFVPSTNIDKENRLERINGRAIPAGGPTILERPGIGRAGEFLEKSRDIESNNNLDPRSRSSGSSSLDNKPILDPRKRKTSSSSKIPRFMFGGLVTPKYLYKGGKLFGGIEGVMDGDMNNNSNESIVASIGVNVIADETASSALSWKDQFIQSVELEKQRKKKLRWIENTITGRKIGWDPTTLQVVEDSWSSRMSAVLEEGGSLNADNLSDALDVAGLIPVVGNLADIANIGVNLYRGDLTSAGLSALAAIPGLGLIAGGLKVAKTANKLAKTTKLTNRAFKGSDAISTLKKVDLAINSAMLAKDVSDEIVDQIDPAQAAAFIGATGVPVVTPQPSGKNPRKFGGGRFGKIIKWTAGASLASLAALATTLVSKRVIETMGADQASTVGSPEKQREMERKIIEDFTRNPPVNMTPEEVRDMTRVLTGESNMPLAPTSRPPDLLPPVDPTAAARKRAEQGISEKWKRNITVGRSLDEDKNGVPDIYEWAIRSIREIEAAAPDNEKFNVRDSKKPGDVLTVEGYLEKIFPYDKWENRQAGDLMDKINGLRSSLVPQKLANGGMVYANNGMLVPYQPKGTDTVPAMLTPGEFVVNRAATQKNLPLLKAINSGADGYSSGGVVYLQDGGWTPEPGFFNKPNAALRAKFKRQNPNLSDDEIENMILDSKGAELAKKLGWEITDSQISRSSEIYAPAAGVVGSYKGYEKGEEPDLSTKLTAEEAKLWSEYQDRQRLEMARKEREAADAPFKQEREELKTRVAQIREEEARQAIEAGIVKPSDLGMQTQDDFSQARKLTAIELAKLRQKEIDDRFAEKAAQRQAEDAKAQASIDQIQQNQQDRANRDAAAAQEINPRTGVAYKDAADKSSEEAVMAFEEARKQAAVDKEQKERKAGEDFQASGGGIKKAQDIQAKFDSDPLFKDYRHDPYLVSKIKLVIQEKYSDDTNDKEPSLSELLSLARNTSLDYWKQQRESAERKQARRQQENSEMITAAAANFMNNLPFVGDGKRYESAFRATYLGDTSADLHIKDAEKEGQALHTTLSEMSAQAENYEGPLGNLAYIGDSIASSIPTALRPGGGWDSGVNSRFDDIQQRQDRYKQQQIEGGNTDFSWENHTNPAVRGFGNVGRYSEELIGGTLGSALNLIGGVSLMAGAGFGMMAKDLGLIDDKEGIIRSIGNKGEEAVGAGMSDFFRAMEQTGRAVGGLGEYVAGYDNPTQLLQGKTQGQLLDERNVVEAGPFGSVVRGAQITRDLARDAAGVPLPIGKGGSMRSVAGKMDDLDPLFTRPTIPSYGLPAKQVSGARFSRGAVTDLNTRRTFGNMQDLLDTEEIEAWAGWLGGRRPFLNDTVPTAADQVRLSSELLPASRSWTASQAREAASRPRPRADLSFQGERYISGPAPRFGRRGSQGVDVFDDPRFEAAANFHMEQNLRTPPGFSQQNVSMDMRIDPDNLPFNMRPQTTTPIARSRPRVSQDNMVSSRFRTPDDGGVDLMVGTQPNTIKPRTVDPEITTSGTGPASAARAASPATDAAIRQSLLRRGLKQDILSNFNETQLRLKREEWLQITREGGQREQAIRQWIEETNRASTAASASFTTPVKPAVASQSGSATQLSAAQQEVMRRVEKLKSLQNAGISSLSPSEFDIYEKLIQDPEVLKNLGLSPIRTPVSRSQGGPIYASKGTLVDFQPKGTDTVPAMLTPGEFVVNAKATQNNLPLLRAINSGAYSSGGVAYLQDGGTYEDFKSNFTGGSSNSKEDRQRQAAEQKKQRQEQYNYQQMMNRFTTPMGKTYTEEVLTKPDIFDLFNPAFLKEEAQPNDLLAKYKEKYDKIKATEPEKLFDIAQADYARDDQRFKYLQMIATNNQAALSQASTDLRKVITVPGKGEYSLGAIINQQLEAASKEAYAYLEGWKLVHAAYPELKQQTAQQQSGVPASAFNRGGVVYANNGILIPYQPRGTDTVPAMLTPGEFVVNRKASQDNLSLLHAINSGHYSGGGPVKYLSGGTPGQPGSNFSAFFQGLGSAIQALTQFSNILTQLTNGVNNNAPAAQGGGAVPGIDLNGLNNFTQKFEAFTQQLAAINIPPEINVNLVQNKAWEVNINGAEVFAALDGKIQEIVNRAIQRLDVGKKEEQQ